MTKVVLVTHFDPLPIGHGGNHRSYQMLYDLENLPGSLQVLKIITPIYANLILNKKQRLLWIVITALIRTAQRLFGFFLYFFYCGNIPRVLTQIRPLENQGYRLKFASKLKEYKESILRGEKPVACIIDHPSFECFIDINKKYSIPTILCGHNLESFDGFIYDRWSYEESMSASIRFADEYKCLSRCDHRLMISMIEKNILDGLGLNTGYYPYIPVGNISERLQSIRGKRQLNPQVPGLLLLLGSFYHLSTAEGMTWLARELTRLGNPKFPLNVIVAGNGTSRLKDNIHLPDWIEVKGWIEQDVLDDLLVRTQGVLIPQRLGFGAVTRLSELACAGIPMLVSEFSTRAFERPPGTYIAGDRIEDWIPNIESLAAGKLTGATSSDYSMWESKLTKGLTSIIKEYL